MKLAVRDRSAYRAALTLVEVVVAFVLIGVASATAYLGFDMLNRQSAYARLFTNATAIAQNEIELFQTDGPFNPQWNQVPDELTVGTQQIPNVIIYTDPDNDNVVVTGTLTRQVSDPGFTAGTPPVNLNVRRVTVKLTYNYRGRNFTVMMDTMRASDT
jgi:type II secretory pathway pseudopilin PulG